MVDICSIANSKVSRLVRIIIGALLLVVALLHRADPFAAFLLALAGIIVLAKGTLVH